MEYIIKRAQWQSQLNKLEKNGHEWCSHQYSKHHLQIIYAKSLQTPTHALQRNLKSKFLCKFASIWLKLKNVNLPSSDNIVNT